MRKKSKSKTTLYKKFIEDSKKVQKNKEEISSENNFEDTIQCENLSKKKSNYYRHKKNRNVAGKIFDVTYSFFIIFVILLILGYLFYPPVQEKINLCIEALSSIGG